VTHPPSPNRLKGGNERGKERRSQMEGNAEIRETRAEQQRQEERREGELL
jgi:hypothetical protein